MYEPREGEPGLIIGRVTDAEVSEPLVGATVLFLKSDCGAGTGRRGLYSIELPPGRYTAEVLMVGYLKQRRVITVRSNDKIVVDFVLERAPLVKPDVN